MYPVLYSYRRCPYAMRARLAIFFAGLKVEQREIVFWNKPVPMLNASPKGTVPVLILPGGEVIDESWEIMLWALQGSSYLPVGQEQQMAAWILKNDEEFKTYLDAYKYSDEFASISQIDARNKGEAFLQQLEQVLQSQRFLLGEQLSAIDLAIFPFVRQFAHVDKAWWQSAAFPSLKKWLAQHMQSEYFKAVMKNRPVWEAGHNPLMVLEPELQTKDQFRNKALSS